MNTLTLALLSAVTLLSPLLAGADPDPLSAYRWEHRLLVLYVPDTQPGRATLETFRTSLDDRMEEVLARDLLIVPVGDLPRPGDLLRPAVDSVRQNAPTCVGDSGCRVGALNSC